MPDIPMTWMQKAARIDMSSRWRDEFDENEHEHVGASSPTLLRSKQDPRRMRMPSEDEDDSDNPINARIESSSKTTEDWADDDDDEFFLSMPPPPPPVLSRQNAVLSLEMLERTMPKAGGPILGTKHGSKPRLAHPYRRQHGAVWSACALQRTPA